MSTRVHFLLLIVLCLALVTACSKQPRSTADVPRTISSSYKIAVAPFTQPVTVSQLIAGQIPQQQGRIPADMLDSLDRQLRASLLSETHRHYDFIARRNLPRDWMRYHSSSQPQALPLWVDYGKKQGAELLLIPQVLDWHQREGSRAGVTESAHVRVEFYLLKVNEGLLMGRSIFEEKQQGLTDNLLNVGSFFKRGGSWITAEQLAQEAIHKAIKDLGL